MKKQSQLNVKKVADINNNFIKYVVLTITDSFGRCILDKIN